MNDQGWLTSPKAAIKSKETHAFAGFLRPQREMISPSFPWNNWNSELYETTQAAKLTPRVNCFKIGEIYGLINDPALVSFYLSRYTTRGGMAGARFHILGMNYERANLYDGEIYFGLKGWKPYAVSRNPPHESGGISFHQTMREKERCFRPREIDILNPFYCAKNVPSTKGIKSRVQKEAEQKSHSEFLCSFCSLIKTKSVKSLSFHLCSEVKMCKILGGCFTRVNKNRKHQSGLQCDKL